MRISDWSSDVCSSDLAGVGHQRLPVHLRREEFAEQAPHLLRRGARAVLPGHRSGEVAAVGGKTNVVRFAQPCPKMTHHVEQNFVTITDKLRFHLVYSAARAAMREPDRKCGGAGKSM